ncbi:MAG: bifunctional [glutamate--ammonia ligase]-adenylyl-L-tyrosine phosphorylase/[glutamate--ammonia-ligase] adenylyltransferase [Burkholderiaceae bacterium]
MSYTAEPFSGYFRRSLFAIGEDDANLQQLNAMMAQPVDTGQLERLIQRYIAILPVEQALRRARRDLMMVLAERDISGQASLAEICQAMTRFAEIVTQCALTEAAGELTTLYGVPCDAEGQPVDLIAMAMGKGGAGELNVSSDLDLVFLYRSDGQTDGESPISTVEFLTKLARRTIGLLAETTADGFVFRIDTRLRPNGDSGPLVCSFAAFEDYLQVQGREWERFAWLKSRAIARTPFAEPALAELDSSHLVELIKPFVFRRYLDYQIFAALRELHDLIQKEARKRDMKRADGIDVKLGRGGIREIEFIAQLFQIVRGGKDRDLRNRATLPTLQALAGHGIVEQNEADDLAKAYELLRRTEHMLQYREDQQTHFLPKAPEIRDQVAAMLQMSPEQFAQAISDARALVERVFDSLLAPDESVPDGSAQAPTPAILSAEEQAEQSRLISIMREGPRYRAAQPDARRALDELIQFAQAVPVERACLIRLIELLESICRRPGYLALLAQYPMAFNRVLAIIETSGWAASYLTRHPVLLDELIDGDLLAPADFAQWQQELAEELKATTRDGEPDLERQMDIAREQHHAQLFRVLARDLDGKLTMEQVSDQLSQLADGLLQVAIDSVWAALPWRFRDHPQVAVIAYGRLGGKELGYASDLDLVFLFDDTDERAQMAYAKLAQRMTTWLSATTAAGTLFEIDLRLRPNGDAGMLVSSLASFADYQTKSAWLWEHQALTRARFCAGDTGLGLRFEALRRDVLGRERDADQVGEKVREMRQKMHDGHPNRGELFDLKHDTGGMVDIEFLVQTLVLTHACHHPDLVENIGNIALLKLAAGHGLIDAALATRVGDAYRTYRRLQRKLRLQGDKYARVKPETVATERTAVTELWAVILKPGPEKNSAGVSIEA